MPEVNEKEHYIYWSFCEYSSGGFRFDVYDEGEHKDKQNPEYADIYERFEFVKSIMLPVVPSDDIVQKGVDALDRMADESRRKCSQEVSALMEKKQQLLALTHTPEVVG